MKTKLKVGDKVFDSALFGNVEGKVERNILTIWDENPDYPIVVRFGEHTASYTIDGKFNKWTKNPTLSMQPYDKLSDIVAVWEEEEVWGLFWTEEFNINGETMAKIYGQMILTGNKDWPYRRKYGCTYKHFKETGKLI